MALTFCFFFVKEKENEKKIRKIPEKAVSIFLPGLFWLHHPQAGSIVHCTITLIREKSIIEYFLPQNHNRFKYFFSP
jgi:hypothetical protein